MEDERTKRPRSIADGMMVLFIVLVVVISVRLYRANDESGMTESSQKDAQGANDLVAIYSAELDYKKAHDGNFSKSLEDLRGLSLSQNHAFSYSPKTSESSGTIVGYSINAVPKIPGKTGAAFFYLSEDGLIRAEMMKPANAGSRVFASAKQ
jgi:hypothetical protein